MRRLLVSISFLWGAVLLGCLTLNSCASGDPSDQALDRLEKAIAQLEQSVASASTKSGERLAPELAAQIEKQGTDLQSAYGEVKIMEDGQLSADQSSRRKSLSERAVNVVADMLNLQLGDEQK